MQPSEEHLKASALATDRVTDTTEGKWELNPAAWFDAKRPLFLDIGCGKGRILYEQPLGDNWNYLGIEKRWKLVALASERLRKRQLGNAYLLRGYAEQILADSFPVACVDRAALLFPDPWPKKRHNKRRIVSREIDGTRFVDQVARVIKPSGLFWLASDHYEYFKVLEEEFDQTKQLSALRDERVPSTLTHFEIKYRQQGRPIQSKVYKKIKA